jgi:hypothetical protein
MTMPPQAGSYTPYQPSFPTMAPTASQFNYQPPPANDLQTILGGLKGTGSTFGMPWSPGYTAQPGITTPMMGRGRGMLPSPLNPAGVNPAPFGPVGPPAKPANQFGGAGMGIAGMDPAMQLKLNMTNHTRQMFGMPPLAPGTPEFANWMHQQNMMPAWAGPAGQGGGGGGPGGNFGGGGSNRPDRGIGDPSAGTHGGQPTF